MKQKLSRKEMYDLAKAVFDKHVYHRFGFSREIFDVMEEYNSLHKTVYPSPNQVIAMFLPAEFDATDIAISSHKTLAGLEVLETMKKMNHEI